MSAVVAVEPRRGEPWRRVVWGFTVVALVAVGWVGRVWSDRLWTEAYARATAASIAEEGWGGFVGVGRTWQMDVAGALAWWGPALAGTLAVWPFVRWCAGVIRARSGATNGGFARALSGSALGRWVAAAVGCVVVARVAHVRALAGPEWLDGLRVGNVMDFAPSSPDEGWLLVSTVAWFAVGGCALMVIVSFSKWFVRSNPALAQLSADLEEDESFWFRKRSLFSRR